MATHHGRPGGRFLEVALGLGLVVLSAGALVAGLALALAAIVGLYGVLYGISPILAYGLMAAGGGATVKLAGPIMTTIWKGLSAIWRPFLTYYGYEAHTLRPIKEDETNDRDAH